MPLHLNAAAANSETALVETGQSGARLYNDSLLYIPSSRLARNTQ